MRPKGCLTLDLLRQIPYFAGLDDSSLAAVAASAVERRFERGQMIFLEGEPCAGLHIITAGRVKVFKLSPQGREQILRQIGVGDTFNEIAVLDGGPNPATTAALSEAVVCCIARADLQRLTHAYPTLAWTLLESIAQRTRRLVGLVEDLSLRSVKARLARLLLAEAHAAGADDEIDRSQMFTQAELAARLGTVREVIGRMLRELADDGLIRFDRHRIFIVDRRGLVGLAEGG